MTSVTHCQLNDSYWEGPLMKKSSWRMVVEALVAEGDVVITLGAGDVWKVGEALLTQLKDRQ